MRISVAGIGASAGGLEALKLLLARLPEKTGLAFVFVQHLDSNRPGNLTGILAGVSAIPVRQAADGMEIEAGHLYVTPPDAGLEIVNQAIKITPRPPLHVGPFMPIDRFLRSLAQECGSRAIGVILSGAGTDGAAGLETVKAAGGVTFAQAPPTAEFDSMPRAAIRSGCVDFVLSPEAIAAELATLARHPLFEPELNADPRDREIAKLKQDLVDARRRPLSIADEHSSEERELLLTGAALAEAQRLTSLIVDTAAAPLLVLDSGLRVITANPSFNRAFRMSPREAEGRPLYSIANGVWNIPGLREMLGRILPDREVVRNFEIERDFPDLGRKVLALTARPLDGLQRILLGIEDITEPGGREDALRESEERFRSMADTAPVLIWVSGPNRDCTFFNKPWLTFTGRTMQQELGDGWADGVHPEDLDRCLDIYTSSFNARRSFQMDYRLRRRDGQYRWVVDNGAPRFESGGVFAGYVGSCVDISDVKTAQEEDFAKQKLETVGALAGGIAHDFNNVLGGILAHSELALTELASGSSPTEELRKIRAAAIRGAEIVRQLMIYAGQESEVLDHVDVAEIVEDMLELLQVSVSKHVKVETDFDKNLPLVRASPTLIRQVAMNLITNASEAIGDRDGVIRVATGRVTVRRNSPRAASESLAEGEYVQLEVTDTGRGMTPEVQARIFDPFFTTKATGSHGQGLVVVQRIVQSLHGHIQLFSAPGKGSTFRILLPAENNVVPATRIAISPAGEETFASREAVILVVDDEDLLRQAVSKMLRKKGFSVFEASDGSGALDVIQTQKDRMDVLLLDVTLPGASSRDVYKEAKRLRPGMAVIVTSAKTQEMAAASLGMNIERFLRKPFKLADLFGMIRDALPPD
jgi:PAS domain S-box-containing protein